MMVYVHSRFSPDSTMIVRSVKLEAHDFHIDLTILARFTDV